MTDWLSLSFPYTCTYACIHAQLLQLYLTFCHPRNCSPPGFSIHRILQERIVKWVALPSSRGSSWLSDQTQVSCVSCIASRFFTTESLGKPTYVYVCAYIYISVQFSYSIMSDSLQLHGLQHSRLPVHHQLPEPTQTHIHRISDAIQPFHLLLSRSPPALNLSQHQGLFQWVGSSNQVAKLLKFQL